jgi:hypothetical protein
VVLFDEVEKAHVDVFNLLLQVRSTSRVCVSALASVCCMRPCGPASAGAAGAAGACSQCVAWHARTRHVCPWLPLQILDDGRVTDSQVRAWA